VKLMVNALIVTTIVLEVRSIVGPYEDWPFTSNTMFAYYRSPETPLYDLRFTVYDESGFARQLEPRADLGTPDHEAFRRLVFSRWYGSTDPHFPQGHVASDSAAFVARMADLCRQITTVMHRRGQPVAALGIEVDRVERTGDSLAVRERTPVGRCEGDSVSFVMAPR
jgi:hypothetical protein